MFPELPDPRRALHPGLHPSRLAGFNSSDSVPKHQILLGMGAAELHLLGTDPELINRAGSRESARTQLEHVCVSLK